MHHTKITELEGELLGVWEEREVGAACHPASVRSLLTVGSIMMLLPRVGGIWEENVTGRI